MKQILDIDDVFFIKNRGLIVTGVITSEATTGVGKDERLIYKPGDKVIVGFDPKHGIETIIQSVELFTRSFTDHSLDMTGRHVGILLKDMTKDDVAKGDKIFLVESEVEEEGIFGFGEEGYIE